LRINAQFITESATFETIKITAFGMAMASLFDLSRANGTNHPTRLNDMTIGAKTNRHEITIRTATPDCRCFQAFRDMSR
jgi:hypothetical protein